MGYKNPEKALRVHIEDDDKLGERIVLSGQNRYVIFINESGLYSLILSSKLLNNNTLQEKLWKDTWTKMMG